MSQKKPETYVTVKIDLTTEEIAYRARARSDLVDQQEELEGRLSEIKKDYKTKLDAKKLEIRRLDNIIKAQKEDRDIPVTIEKDYDNGVMRFFSGSGEEVLSRPMTPSESQKDIFETIEDKEDEDEAPFEVDIEEDVSDVVEDTGDPELDTAYEESGDEIPFGHTVPSDIPANDVVPEAEKQSPDETTEEEGEGLDEDNIGDTGEEVDDLVPSSWHDEELEEPSDEVVAREDISFTVAEAAKYLNKSTSTVRKKIKDGVFPGAAKDGDVWLIPKLELDLHG